MSNYTGRMIDLNDKGLVAVPDRVYVKGNSRWWAPSVSESYSQATTQGNRDLELRGWIQALIDQDLLDLPSGSGGGDVYAVADITARDNIANPEEGDVAIIANADGSNHLGLSFYDGSAWSTAVITNFGEANTAANLGAGTGLFATKTSAQLNFKSLVAGSGISLANDANTVTVSSTAAGITRYSALTDRVWVTATGPGITAAINSGVCTIAIPTGVELLSAVVHGATADLNSNNFSVALNHVVGVGYNQSLTTMYPPNIDVINTASTVGGGPTEGLPFVYDEMTSPQVQITALASGDITTRVVGLNVFSNWAIKLAL